MNDSKSHISALDSLRGVAALCVVLLHMPWLPMREITFVKNGYLMVDFFFVLSGFVIAYSYEDEIRKGIDLSRFMWLRFWRLYPVHLVMLLVFVVIEFAEYVAQHRIGIGGMHHPAFSANNFYAFVTNLFLVQALHTNSVLTFDGPSWSISVEFWTYLLFGGIVLALTKLRVPRLPVMVTIWATALIALVLISNRPLTLTWDWGILRGIAGFFLGVVLHHLHMALRARTAGGPEIARGFDVAAALALAGAIVFLLLEQRYTYSTLLILPITSMLILGCAMAPQGYMTRILTVRPLRWLGAISYSIYMVHFAVIRVVVAVLRLVFKMPSTDIMVSNLHVPTIAATPLAGGAAAAAAVAVTLVAAQLSYRGIEMPWRSWSKRVLRSGFGGPAVAQT